jgi:hypothetical protein
MSKKEKSNEELDPEDAGGEEEPAYTIQDFAHQYAKNFLKEKYPDCGYSISDLLDLVNLAVLDWENSAHREALRSSSEIVRKSAPEEPHSGIEILMRLLLRNPPVASEWILTIHPKVKRLKAHLNVIFMGGSPKDANERAAELIDKYGDEYMNPHSRKTFSRFKADLKKAKAEMTPADPVAGLKAAIAAKGTEMSPQELEWKKSTIEVSELKEEEAKAKKAVDVAKSATEKSVASEKLEGVRLALAEGKANLLRATEEWVSVLNRSKP